MRGECDRLEVDGDEPGRADLDVRVAGRELEGGIRHVRPLEHPLDRLAGEVKPQSRAVDLGLPVGVVVDLEDHVGPAGQGAADAVGEVHGLVPRGPAAQVAGDLDAGPRVRDVARPRLGRVAMPAVRVGVDERHHMVHHAAVPRPVLDRRDRHVAREVRGDHEAPVDVRARGGDPEILRHLEHEVRRAQRPSLGEPGRGRHMRRLAPRGARIGPRLEYGDLLRRQRAVVLELGPYPGCGLPGGHREVCGHRGDVRSALPSLLICLQRKRPDLVAAVTALASLLEDRCHVLGECRRPDHSSRFFALTHGGAQPKDPCCEPNTCKPGPSYGRPDVSKPHSDGPPARCGEVASDA